jgi:hypothetical protein
MAASDALSSIQSDSGSPFALNRQPVDTSTVFIGNSMDYATSWRNRKGQGNPNPAALGRGNLLTPDAATPQPVEVR